MKLFEIKGPYKEHHSLEYEMLNGVFGVLDLDITFTFESGYWQQHEPDNDSFKEYMPGELEIIDIKLEKSAEQFDPEDDEQILKIWPVGTDVKNLPSWTDKNEKEVEDQLIKELKLKF